jgi:hypothetical protein
MMYTSHQAHRKGWKTHPNVLMAFTLDHAVAPAAAGGRRRLQLFAG